MSRTIRNAPEIEPEPGANYTPAYREFFARLRSARIEKGLSIAYMSDEVALTFKLACDFEKLVTPLPFEWLEVWCQVVGVPFADYLAVYWASEEAYFQKLEREREAQEAQAARERGDTANAPVETEAGATETEALAPSNPTVNRSLSFLLTLRAAFTRVTRFLRAFFSTPRETPD